MGLPELIDINSGKKIFPGGRFGRVRRVDSNGVEIVFNTEHRHGGTEVIEPTEIGQTIWETYDKICLERPLVGLGIVGLVNTAMASAMSPFVVVKTTMQTQRVPKGTTHVPTLNNAADMLKEAYGSYKAALWRGNTIGIVRSFVQPSVKHTMTLGIYKATGFAGNLTLLGRIAPSGNPFFSILTHLLSSTAAALILSPLDFLRNRIIVYKHTDGVIRAASDIYKSEGGFTAFMRAWRASLLCGTISAVIPIIHNILLVTLLRLEPGSPLHLIAQCGLGFIECVCTLPFETACERLRADRVVLDERNVKKIPGSMVALNASSKQYLGIRDCIERIIAEEGVDGLYWGFRWQFTYRCALFVTSAGLLRFWGSGE